jgi:integrase
MAKIRNRGNGKWEVVVELPRDGQRRQKSTMVRGTKADAERVRAELVLRAEQGEWAPDGATFGSLVDRFLAWADTNLEATTVREYRRLSEQRIKPAVGRLPARRLSALDLDRWYAELGAEGLSPNSVRQIHAVVRSTGRQAVRWGLLTHNPATSATPPKQRPSTINAPTRVEVEKLLQAADEETDPTWPIAVRLDLVTGLRRGALAGLQWHDLTPAPAGRSVLQVRRTVIHARGGIAFKPYTKNRTHHSIALDPAATAMLDAWSEQTRRLYLDLNGRHRPPDAPILSIDGWLQTPILPDTITQAWTRIRARAGLDHVRLHDLRHFVATELIAAGVPLPVVAERLGHADQTTTARLYVHPTTEQAFQAGDIMGGFL